MINNVFSKIKVLMLFFYGKSVCFLNLARAREDILPS